MVRKGSEEILHGCNAIDHLWTTSAPEKNRRSFRDLRTDARLVRQLRKQRFDWSFELTDGDRGRWISLLAQPRQRATTSVGWPLQWIWRRHFTLKSSWDWMQAHRVEKDYRLVHEALGLPLDIPPLAFSPEHRQRVDLPDAGPLDDYVVIHPATRWERKKWPEDRWITLGHHLLTRTKKLVLTCGPEPSEVASVNRIQAALGSACHSTHGRLSWSQSASSVLAGCLTLIH